MIKRIWFWLTHIHKWETVSKVNLQDTDDGIPIGFRFVQKCNHEFCQKYKRQDLI